MGSAALTAAVALVAGLQALFDVSIRNTHFLTGWILLSLVVALALFNARKKLPFLPLGSAASWMQLHIYAGLLAALVYAAHAGVAVPRGSLETWLAAAFVAVAASGVVGLTVTRVIPVGLSGRGEAVLFERIPSLRARLKEEVEGLVLRSAHDQESTAIADFYSDRLTGFLEGPRNTGSHLLGWSRPIRELDREIEALGRYLDDRERGVLEEIRVRVRLKDDLDFQRARQLVLRGWLFVHIPLTYSLLILAGVHVLLVYSFSR